MSNPFGSDDEPIFPGSFISSPLFDLFPEESTALSSFDWKNLEFPNSPILPPQNPIPHRRTRTQPIPRITQSQPFYNLPSQVSMNRHLTKTAKSIDRFCVGQNSRDFLLPKETSEDDQFIQICNDKNHLINPHQLGFIPQGFWPNESYQFGDIVRDFFHRKNHPSGRFSHKLYNALKLTESNNYYFQFTGVEWKSKEVLHVDKIRFARLLGIKSIDGSLFHQQGNFPAFGFAELPMLEIQKLFGDDVIKNSNIDVDHYLIHNPGVFVSDCTEQDIADDIKWKGIRQRSIV